MPRRGKLGYHGSPSSMTMVVTVIMPFWESLSSFALLRLAARCSSRAIIKKIANNMQVVGRRFD